MGTKPKSEVCKEKPRAEDLVLVFDWDDTLLPSSWLSSAGLSLNSSSGDVEAHRNALKSVEKKACELLKKAIETTPNVFLVTNAESGWVELSALKFVPSIHPILTSVTVVSARSNWEGSFPNEPVKWKIQAFQKALEDVWGQLEEKTVVTRKRKRNGFSVNKSRHIISFGDSHHERTALKHVTASRVGIFSKNIKFVERPSSEMLVKQIELVCDAFEYVCSEERHIDLMLKSSSSQATKAS